MKSRGCGDMKRRRSRPSTAATSLSSRAKAPRSPSSTPYALTFCPRSVISITPWSTRVRTSARTSAMGRSFSTPRKVGTIQNVQVLLHPTEIETHDEKAEKRRAGSVDGKCSSASRISICDSSSILARSSRIGREPTLCVPKTTST